ncbi:MAG TPA: sulfite exporter TauE/SafE family protein [Candidatus Poseidoniales archaeon]|nr:MAG TPA: sulfite exporter TauE/SafE family protein [Candidatus Poseidoniales archaeon]|tara:strand:- start:1592 stop:2425 length:834 start_codon:yes stop_codon:yes gene_type:complete
MVFADNNQFCMAIVYIECYLCNLNYASNVEINLLLASMAVTFVAAALTVPAGFGLATMLTPVVLVWLPPHEAIAVVAIIHGAHNAWKLKLLQSSVDYDAVRRYGWALVVGAIIGALLHSYIPSDPLLLVVGLALVVLPILSVTERWTDFRLPESEDRVGGFGSGFFGGLTGHQGALRAMFLQKRLPSKVSYAATASILALAVDLTRIPIYLVFEGRAILDEYVIVIALVLSAIAGVNLGKVWLTKWQQSKIRSGILFGIVASGILYIAKAVSNLGIW